MVDVTGHIVPEHLNINADWQLWLTIAFGIAALVSWIYGARVAQKEKALWPLLVVAGGSLAVLGEAPVDILGLAYWTENGQWTLYEAFGRRIPFITLGAYTAFFGGVALFTLRQFEQGATAKTLYWSFISWMVMEWCWEPIPIHYGVWSYYGAQPFRFLDFPMWWPPVNTIGAFSSALLIWKVKPYLKGVSQLAIVPLVLSGDLMGNALVAWPLWITLNMDVGYAVTIPAGVLTLILCYLALKIMVRMVTESRQPV
ncbi:MAG: hypothetical protein ACI9FD_000894 [Gammaproteobacteria bacterium]|jgi:hypothetical protein